MKYVEVKYRGSTSEKTYGYLYDGEVTIGDVVIVPLGSREKSAIVVDWYTIKNVIRVEKPTE